MKNKYLILCAISSLMVADHVYGMKQQTFNILEHNGINPRYIEEDIEREADNQRRAGVSEKKVEEFLDKERKNLEKMKDIGWGEFKEEYNSEGPRIRDLEIAESVEEHGDDNNQTDISDLILDDYSFDEVIN